MFLKLTTLKFSVLVSSAMASYISPVVNTLCVLAALVCVAFLINAGFHYMTSSGNPEKLNHAKKIIKEALVGLVIVLGAATITAVLSHAYGNQSQNLSQNLPNLGNVQPASASYSLVDVIIKAITGLLNYLIQSIGSPIIKALTYFTSGTPLMAENTSVFKMWLAMTGIADSLFILVICLLGFHIMSATSLGLDELNIKHLLPRLSLVFLLINSSVFVIDGIISLSNAIIAALYSGFGNLKIWAVLTAIANQSGAMGLAALIIMTIFLVLAFILLIYYVGRLVTLYLGAVLAPLIILLWLLPSFQDFAASAIKSYISTIFVLFIHVVILMLAGSLLLTIISGNPNGQNTIMSLAVGMSTLIALIKTQGVMSQMNYASIGPRSIRRLSSQLINSINNAVA